MQILLILVHLLWHESNGVVVGDVFMKEVACIYVFVIILKLLFYLLFVFYLTCGLKI